LSRTTCFIPNHGTFGGYQAAHCELVSSSPRMSSLRSCLKRQLSLGHQRFVTFSCHQPFFLLNHTGKVIPCPSVMPCALDIWLSPFQRCRVAQSTPAGGMQALELVETPSLHFRKFLPVLPQSQIRTYMSAPGSGSRENC